MCQFIVEDMIESRRIFVAPISRISFERGHPIKLQYRRLPKTSCKRRRQPMEMRQFAPRRSITPDRSNEALTHLEANEAPLA